MMEICSQLLKLFAYFFDGHGIYIILTTFVDFQRQSLGDLSIGLN